MITINGPIDWQAILAITNNKPELAKEMITMLGDELPDMQKTINQAYTEKRYSILLEKVHKLHGSCCYCGVSELKNITATLETRLKERNYTDLPKLILRLNQEIKSILQYISEQT